MTHAPQPTYWHAVVGRFRTALDSRQLDSVAQWRSRFEAFVILALIVAVPLAMPNAIPVLLGAGHWPLLVLDAVLWIWALSAALRPRAPVQPAAILAVLYAMFASFLVAMGPSEARPAWMVAVPVIGALLFGARAAVLCVCVNLALLLLCYFVIGPSLPAWQPVYAAPAARWWLFVSSATTLSLVASLPIGLLLDSVSELIDQERKLRALLLREHEELEHAHLTLLAESTQRERLERELQQAQKLEALGNLAGGVAHDLNNFLVPVVLYTEMVRRGLSPSSKEHALLSNVLTAGQHAKELVARVLAFSRKVPPPDEYVQLPELIAQLVEQQRATLPANIHIVQDLDSDCAPVFAHRIALAQVVVNLVSNAVDAMPSGGTLTVRLRGSTATSRDAAASPNARGLAQLTVSDTGVGMDEQTAARVFEPFFTTKPLGEGSGLGLATAHGIVSSLGGRITLQTAPGSGTTFTVELPTHMEPPGARVATDEQLTATTLSGRVLLVDDDSAGRAALRVELQELGLAVETASNVPLALLRVAQGREPFDAIITDYQMREASGLDLVAALRERGDRIPVVLITGFADDFVLLRARELQILAVLQKPFARAELVRTLRPVLG